MEIIVFIFNIIIAIIFILVKLILAPIDYFIEQALPQVADGLEAVGDFITIMVTGLGWAISASAVPYTAIAFIATYWIFKLTFPINIYFIKLALKWYRAIK